MFRSRLLFDAQLQTERRAKCCVSIPRGSGSPLERSQRPCGYRGSPIHFGLVRFFMAIPTELRSRRHGVGTFLRKHIGLAMLSAGSTLGAARPQPAPKSRMWKRHCRLSGLSSRCGGVVLVRTHILAKSANAPISAPTLAKPGYTERPARVQFMLGRVGLYSTKFSCIARQQVEPALPASRPQAARSRVACAKRSGCRHCRPCAKRCGSRTAARRVNSEIICRNSLFKWQSVC